ncbi:MAG TPA: hypothetical protein VF817_01895 [Patescibacteria group bacterium]
MSSHTYLAGEGKSSVILTKKLGVIDGTPKPLNERGYKLKADPKRVAPGKRSSKKKPAHTANKLLKKV